MHDLKWQETWDFDAGRLPLDFANTAEWHDSPDTIEKLNSYTDLVGWSKAAGLLTADEASSLLLRAARDPSRAEEALTEAIELREAIFQIFSAIAAGSDAPEDSLNTLNSALAKALRYARIVPLTEGYSWGWSEDEQNLERVLWPIIQSTGELLTSGELKRIGKCADDQGCGYLFYDTSRNHSRRWCSMESCGNRAKVRRHYSRSKLVDKAKQ